MLIQRVSDRTLLILRGGSVVERYSVIGRGERWSIETQGEASRIGAEILPPSDTMATQKEAEVVLDMIEFALKRTAGIYIKRTLMWGVGGLLAGIMAATTGAMIARHGAAPPARPALPAALMNSMMGPQAADMRGLPPIAGLMAGHPGMPGMGGAGAEDALLDRSAAPAPPAAAGHGFVAPSHPIPLPAIPDAPPAHTETPPSPAADVTDPLQDSEAPSASGTQAGAEQEAARVAALRDQIAVLQGVEDRLPGSDYASYKSLSQEMPDLTARTR